MVTCLYLYHVTIGNGGQALLRIPFTLYGKAYHEMFIVQIKDKIQILNGNNNSS